MMILNNKDLKLAIRDARELCPNEGIKKLLSKDNVMITDVFYGNTGIKNLLKSSLTLMVNWNDSVAVEVKKTFTKYIKSNDITIN